jgi:hypothetical protein
VHVVNQSKQLNHLKISNTCNCLQTNYIRYCITLINTSIMLLYILLYILFFLLGYENRMRSFRVFVFNYLQSENKKAKTRNNFCSHFRLFSFSLTFESKTKVTQSFYTKSMFCLTSQYTETKKHLERPTFVICFYHFYIYIIFRLYKMQLP